jgi:hypothetical protein
MFAMDVIADLWLLHSLNLLPDEPAVADQGSGVSQNDPQQPGPHRVAADLSSDPLIHFFAAVRPRIEAHGFRIAENLKERRRVGGLKFAEQQTWSRDGEHSYDFFRSG